MIQWMLMSMLITLNFIFMYMKHPLAMGLILMLQTMLMCMMTGLTTNSFWFSYMLFLIFMGGMLVMFIYITSLASNEMFSYSIQLSMSSMMIVLFMMIMFFYLNNKMLNYQNLEIQLMFKPNSYIMENSLNINKLYNYPTNLLTILLMNYLLITLIGVVKITKLFMGPLRPMFN